MKTMKENRKKENNSALFFTWRYPPKKHSEVERISGDKQVFTFFFDFVKFFIFPHNFFFALGNEVGVTGKNSLRCDHRRKRIKTFFFVLWPNFCCAPHASQQFPMILVAARISKSANRKYYNLQKFTQKSGQKQSRAKAAKKKWAKMARSCSKRPKMGKSGPQWAKRG